MQLIVINRFDCTSSNTWLTERVYIHVHVLNVCNAYHALNEHSVFSVSSQQILLSSPSHKDNFLLREEKNHIGCIVQLKRLNIYHILLFIHILFKFQVNTMNWSEN